MSTVSNIDERINEEKPFSIEELFFSRTDERGVIQSGNSVFQRVSAFDWDEIIKAPHRVIRHPDMPKAVFWLLWDTIKKGEPIGAYVKNKAKDGCYYWVFAIVTPIEGGYSSTRIKPSSDVFKLIEREYEALRIVENERNLDAEDSAKILLERIKELGFRDYKSFMAHALSAEIKARDEQLGRSVNGNVGCFDRLETSAKYLLGKTEEILKVYSENEYVPLNLRVQATQLGNVGLPMCIVSNNYTAISEELQSDMAVFTEKSKEVARTIDNGQFLTAAAQIQSEMIEAFGNETPSGFFDHEDELNNLQSQQAIHTKNAAASLVEISRQINAFAENCADMRRLSTSLEVTRVMGKIESASLGSSISSLDALIDDLGVFQKALMDGLKEIDDANKALHVDVTQLLKAA
ncbi:MULTISPECIES: PAS domain-containing protein [unclassified Lentilitoribacter]|jgi:aerotaxis receptor|uniref:PAS domain-containing protein n=1 Tax=unclassified Lentilitoribacter TaxID=2647570 RepID=UPI0013A6B370|nr:PAS domain-containing protein [Lentilitoribacter sp. Alg239-R112]